MNTKSRTFRWGAIAMALLIGGVLIVIAGGVLLPSTKRSRLSPEDLQRLEEKWATRNAAKTTGAKAADPNMRAPAGEFNPEESPPPPASAPSATGSITPPSSMVAPTTQPVESRP